MKELRFENLYNPEYYLDYPGYDSRIAIMKFIDARDTMGMAKLSLSYIDTKATNEIDRNFTRIMHLRHAMEDLNSSFDLLLQIPWFFYRIWEAYNIDGGLREKKLKNKSEVRRNTDNWVTNAEESCEKKKVIKYFNSVQSDMEHKIEEFYNEYIINSKKPFTVRTLCNAMKHNHALAFDELYKPYDFTIEIDGEVKNLRNEKIGMRCHQDISRYSETTGESTKVGQIKYSYEKDLIVDIEYTNSDTFRFEDCTRDRYRFKIEEVYKECCAYYDAIVDLYEEIYKDIYPKMILLETFTGLDGKPTINKSEEKINLNKYFTVS